MNSLNSLLLGDLGVAKAISLESLNVAGSHRKFRVHGDILNLVKSDNVEQNFLFFQIGWLNRW